MTVDLARRTDGVWRVVELGDGQVSDRPATTDPNEIVALISDTIRQTPNRQKAAPPADH